MAAAKIAAVYNIKAHEPVLLKDANNLGHLRSFTVAVWCWLQPDRAPEVRAAAEYHLHRLHKLA